MKKLSEAMLAGWKLMQERNLRQIYSDYINENGACALGAALLARYPDLHLYLDLLTRDKVTSLLEREFPELDNYGPHGQSFWTIITNKNDDKKESIPTIAEWLKEYGL